MEMKGKTVINGGENRGKVSENLHTPDSRGTVIRLAEAADLEAVTAVEALCFPAAEAAGREAMEARLQAFPECFLVACREGEILGFINGAATDERTIRDEMYEDAGLHRPDGRYQAVFGLDVVPGERRRGLAERLMKAFIAMARERGKMGVMLTCKDRLIPYYEKFGYVNQGISASVHGNAVWYDMILEF